MEIKINGLIYESKKIDVKETDKVSKMSTMLLGIASYMFIGQSRLGSSKMQKSSEPKVNLIDEFRLIQNKQSKLSRKDRNWVIFQFNRNFKLVELK